MNIHIWIKPADASRVTLYTISEGKIAIAIDLPIEAALDSLRVHLEAQ